MSLNVVNQVEVSGRLDPEFAGQLLELELLVETYADYGVVVRLLDLYKTAIEHFAGKRDPRYLIFEKRMQSSLLKPEVQSAIRRSNCGESPKTTRDQIKLRKVKIELVKIKRAQRTNENVCENLTPRSALSSHAVASDQACQKVTWQLKQQSGDLAMRLRQRQAQRCSTVTKWSGRRRLTTLA
jgi:hypothetical protein